MDAELDPTLDPPSHLALILDLNPAQWHRSAQTTAEHPLSLSDFLTQTLTFLNAHLAGKHENTLAVIGAFPDTSKMLYSTADPPSDSYLGLDSHPANSFRPFRLVDATLIKRIQDEFDYLDDTDTQNNRGLVGAITKSLCYINRVKKIPEVETGLSGNTSKTNTKSIPQILILSVSPDLSTSYIPLMNSIFAAQKLKVTIDVCKLFGPDTVFLQQAAHLTGGSYVYLDKREALLQYLLMCFLPSPTLRGILSRPTQDKVDFRAACFCHKDIVDIGYVCSVCLSIFCKATPVCSTCRTKFPYKTVQRYLLNGQANGVSRT